MEMNERIKTTLCYRFYGNDIEIDVEIGPNELADYSVEMSSERGHKKEYYQALRETALKVITEEGYDPSEIVYSEGFEEYIKPFYEDAARRKFDRVYGY